MTTATYDKSSGVEICIDISEEDGAVLVFIDTPSSQNSPIEDNQDGPAPLRIYLNDEPLYENPEYPAEDRCEHGMFYSGAGACPKCGGGAE